MVGFQIFERTKKMAEIKLVGDREKTIIDAATIKDLYGGVKY